MTNVVKNKRLEVISGDEPSEVIKSKLENNIEVLKQKVSSVDIAISSNKEAKARYSVELNKAIQHLKSMDTVPEFCVSNHAIIRFMERHMCLDIETLRQQMLSEAVKEKIVACGGTGKFEVGSGRLVVENYSVITYLPLNNKGGTY